MARYRYVIAAAARESQVVPGAQATRSDDWRIIDETDDRVEADCLVTEMEADEEYAGFTFRVLDMEDELDRQHRFVEF